MPDGRVLKRRLHDAEKRYSKLQKRFKIEQKKNLSQQKKVKSLIEALDDLKEQEVIPSSASINLKSLLTPFIHQLLERMTKNTERVIKH